MKWEDILKINLAEARRLGNQYARTDMKRGEAEARQKKFLEENRGPTKKAQEQNKNEYRKIQEIFKRYNDLFRGEEKEIRSLMKELNGLMAEEVLDEDDRNRIRHIVRLFARYFRRKGVDLKTGKTLFELEG